MLSWEGSQGAKECVSDEHAGDAAAIIRGGTKPDVMIQMSGFRYKCHDSGVMIPIKKP